MADGTTKPIQYVRAGDEVWSRDPHTGKTEAKRVIGTKRRASPDLVTIALSDAATHKVVQTLTGTPNHPFFTPGNKQVPMGDLSVGTSILTRADPALVASSVRVQHQAARHERFGVFNFEVADDHSYFVGTPNGGGGYILCRRQ